MTNSRKSIIIESKLDGIHSLKDLLSCYNSCFDNTELYTYLNRLLNRKKMTKSQIFNRTQMGRTYIYQIFSNKRHPSRNKLLQIAMAMQCTLEETQNLLLLSQYSPLSFRNKRDLIIAYCLHKRIDTFELNAQLYDFNEEPLFNEE